MFIIIFLLILYILYIDQNKLPLCIINIFNNIIFKIIFVFILININPIQIKILMIISYVFTLEYIYINNSIKIKNNIKNLHSQINYN